LATKQIKAGMGGLQKETFGYGIQNAPRNLHGSDKALLTAWVVP
jgi:hypothetical protein